MMRTRTPGTGRLFRFGLSLHVAAAVLAASNPAVTWAEETGRVVFDFETGDLQGWRVVEGQFAKLLNDREMFRNRSGQKFNQQGKYFLDTVEPRDDRQTGVVESPVFVLTGPEATFQVGGGRHADTYVALCTLDGKEVLKAQGVNDEVFQPRTWDVKPYVGKPVFLRIVDHHQQGWGHVLFDDFRAPGKIDAEATRARFSSLDRLREERKRQQLVEASRASEDALRRAIEDLSATFPIRYTGREQYLARLDRLREKTNAAAVSQLDALGEELNALAREALIANPLVSERPILFVVRHQYKTDHHNTATMFQTGEINTGSFQGGGAVKSIDLARNGEIRTLLELPEGVARDLDVRFDGQKILLSLRRNRDDDYHLHEINADGTGLVQLTFGSGLSDIDPIYLPDGRILFTSTREPKFCMCNRHIMGNLFTMNGDGSNIQQIGHSTLHEGHAALTPDGRVLYDRWEYVDRNFGDAQGVWSVNPDGTNHAVYWGNSTNSPGAVLDTRVIPGTEQAIATFSSCHDRPWGAIAILDRRRGLDLRPPVLRTWPPEAIDLIGVGNYDTYQRVNPKYEDPYPLSDKYFLASGMIGQGEKMGIWLLDLFGNEVLLHTDDLGCFDPMPLGPRPTPPAVTSRVDLARSEGYFYVSDVYAGTGMETIDRGTVTHLRVVESPEKRFWTREAWNGSGTQAPGMAWDDFNNKRILGTVPVEDDGSAYFAVPADTFVYFQLLDASGMMIQSMRSGTIVRPGETAGCVGCHDSRRGSIPPGDGRMATGRGPSKLTPWYGLPRKFSYAQEVQPVFDTHCVECHDYRQEAGRTLNLAGDLGPMFNTSYYELRSKGYVNVPGAGPSQVLKPKSWGSHASRLVEVLLAGHEDPKIDKTIKLSSEDFDRIVTWVDINAPYYADYASAYRGNRYGRSPLDPGQVARLNQLLGIDLNDQKNASQLSFTRPELSPGLEKFSNTSDPNYREALAIIEAGREMLAQRPRADMPGFQLTSQTEIDQEAKYQARLKREAAMRKSIARGEKRYDPSPAGGQ